MSGPRQLSTLAIATALLFGACAGAAPTTAPATPVAPAPTLVPPALAFADDVTNASTQAGLWTEVETNDGLASCLAGASASESDSIDGLRNDLLALGDDGQAIIADCLTGA